MRALKALLRTDKDVEPDLRPAKRVFVLEVRESEVESLLAE